ncbi:MAG: hypothetical protein AAF368_17665, partial [Planctomycetota bacterium]
MALGVVLAMAGSALAQNYPSTTAAPGGPSDAEREMMRVRNAAEGARGEAQAAAMTRAADLSLEQSNEDRAIQSARQRKAIKRQMEERARWEQRNGQVRKISSDQMEAWDREDAAAAQTPARVERDVPRNFVASVVEEEALAASRVPKKKGFAPFSATKKALNWRPFQGDGGRNSDDYDPLQAATLSVAAPVEAPQEAERGGGFMGLGNVKMPKLSIPKFGKDKKEEAEAFVESEPIFRASSEPESAVGEGSTPPAPESRVPASRAEPAIYASPESPAPVREADTPPDRTRVQTVAAVDEAESGNSGFFGMFNSHKGPKPSRVETPSSRSGSGG